MFVLDPWFSARLTELVGSVNMQYIQGKHTQFGIRNLICDTEHRESRMFVHDPWFSACLTELVGSVNMRYIQGKHTQFRIPNSEFRIM